MSSEVGSCLLGVPYMVKKFKGRLYGEMAQQLRASVALIEGTDSIPSTHIRHFTTVCNPNFGASDAFGLLSHLELMFT